MYRRVRELSGNFSVSLKFKLVNMPLVNGLLVRAWKNPTFPSHVELRFGSPLAALGKYGTDTSLAKIMPSEH